MPKYAWERQWLLRGEQRHHGIEGELSELLSDSNVRSRLPEEATSNLSIFPCAIMLGEPGSGKSTEFAAEFQRTQSESKARGDATLLVDLKDFQSDVRLVMESFENQTVKAWIEGTHTLFMFFDSLDEGRIEIKNIANVLAREFRKLAPYVSRLRVRIACRTVEWPLSLEDTLKAIYQGDFVGVFDLAPLSAEDVRIAAICEGIDADNFLEELMAKGVQPFSRNPITLKFLMQIRLQNGELPVSRYHLYEQGCLHLSGEFNQSRLDAGHYGALTARQRLEVACRIAAGTVFCGRVVLKRESLLTDNGEAISLQSFAGGFEEVDNDRFMLTEDGVRDCASTALFIGHGPNAFTFAHRTYAEFLAARYVSQRDLDETQIMSLLFHTADHGTVIPQLSEVAAWLATKESFVFEKLMSGDVQCLLRSDVATADVAVKSRLTQAFLSGFDSGELDDSDWGLRDHYHKLAHPGLASQLSPLITDSSKNFVLRRFAIHVARECRLDEILDALRSVALDDGEDVEIRSEACRSLVSMATIELLRCLKPLAMGMTASDPRDELRGIALRALWSRRLITASEAFHSLSRPASRSFIGDYRHFLLKEFTPFLRLDDLSDGLRWCSSISRHSGPPDEVASIASHVLEQAVKNLDRVVVKDAFIEFAVKQLDQNETLKITTEAFASVSNELRRELVQRIVPLLKDVSGAVFGLTIARPQLIREDELSWLLSKSLEAAEKKDKRAWAILARARFAYCNKGKLDEVLSACDREPEIAEEFEALFRPIEIYSDEATRLRRQYTRIKEMESEEAELHTLPPLLDPPPTIQVEDSLRRCEEGDITAWCDLNRALQLEPRSTHYMHDSNGDLTSFPGWNAADSATHSRILLCAQRYLHEWTPRPGRLTGSRHIFQSDLDGYRALALLEICDPSVLELLDDNRWSVLAPVIFDFPCTCGLGDEAESTQERLIGIAYRKAPVAVRNIVSQTIDEESAEENSQHLFVVQRIDHVTDEAMLEMLLDKAKSGNLSAPCLSYLLNFLIAKKNEEAFRFGLAVVGKRHDDKERQKAIHVSAVTWGHSPNESWAVLWPEFNSDPEFCKSVMLALGRSSGPGLRVPRELPEDRLADLFILLSQHFPQSQDPAHDGAHFVSERDSVKEYRDGVLGALRSRGTLASCIQLDRIVAAFPDAGYLKWYARAARRHMLQVTWNPLSVPQLKELTQKRGTRLVRSELDFQNVIMESISRLQSRLQGETPASRDLWDRSNDEWRPVDENELSDYVKRHFDIDLHQSGIIALREVEIRRGVHHSGERTDIYLAATVEGQESGKFGLVRVIVEAKGCWNPDLKTAMQCQLKDRYLKDNDCEHGIYLIGWFPRDQWTVSDPRHRSARAWSRSEAVEFFKKQAEGMSSAECLIESVILDVSLR